MATMSFISLWLHASDSFQWDDFTVHSHALALFCVYLLWYVKVEGEKRVLPTPRSSPKQSSKKVEDPALSTKKGIEAPLSLAVSISSDESTGGQSADRSADEIVAEACPEATSVERQRFLAARSSHVPSAIRTLRHYLDWNNQHEKVAKHHNIVRQATENPDMDVWIEVCAIAMKASGESGEPKLPQVIRTYKVEGESVTDLEGHRIFHIMPAQMDNTLAHGSTYALATALFLNKHLDRNGSERITVCMDVRAGKGWPNIHAMRQVPFMKATTMLLLSLFPERLQKSLVFPVPSAFLWIWNVVSKILDRCTRDKICVLAGPNKIISPPPLEGMMPHLGKEVAQLLEEARVADFKD
jgi:hypothetical protein